MDGTSRGWRGEVAEGIELLLVTAQDCGDEGADNRRRFEIETARQSEQGHLNQNERVLFSASALIHAA